MALNFSGWPHKPPLHLNLRQFAGTLFAGNLDNVTFIQIFWNNHFVAPGGFGWEMKVGNENALGEILGINTAP